MHGMRRKAQVSSSQELGSAPRRDASIQGSLRAELSKAMRVSELSKAMRVSKALPTKAGFPY